MIRMLIELLSSNDSLVLDVPDEISALLPFNTELIRWKDEIYFSTPYLAKLDSLRPYTQIVPGKVYYWPPERAFCIFYGLSEPYSRVYIIGEYIGPLNLARKINIGSITVVKHESYEGLSDIVTTMNRLRYSTATPLDSGSRIVVASRYIDDIRIAFTIIKEDFGIYIESDSFYRFMNSYEDVKVAFKLKNKIRTLTSMVRFDLSEDGHTCLTATVDSVDKLEAVISELERAYQYLYREIAYAA